MLRSLNNGKLLLIVAALCSCLLFPCTVFGQSNVSSTSSFTFAFVSDTHIGAPTSVEDLKLTVADINQLPNISFVVVTGDITNFGTDEQLKKAEDILDELQMPWHVIPGNHDSNWSESGTTSFNTTFGYSRFAFHSHGYFFIGVASGPNMRMAPGLVPHEDIVWLKIN